MKWSLLKCNYVFLPTVSKKCGITAQMLFGQPPFSVVFKEFMMWIKECVQEACRNNEVYCPGKV